MHAVINTSKCSSLYSYFFKVSIFKYKLTFKIHICMYSISFFSGSLKGHMFRLKGIYDCSAIILVKHTHHMTKIDFFFWQDDIFGTLTANPVFHFSKKKTKKNMSYLPRMKPTPSCLPCASPELCTWRCHFCAWLQTVSRWEPWRMPLKSSESRWDVKRCRCPLGSGAEKGSGLQLTGACCLSTAK